MQSSQPVKFGARAANDGGYNDVQPSGYIGRTAMEVGVRKLRNNPSRYLERVRDGEEVVVTDRGRAIARVSPIGVERVLDRSSPQVS